MKKTVILHFARRVSSTSMPWNDLHLNLIKKKQTSIFVEVKGFGFSMKRKSINVEGIEREYWSVTFLSLAFFVITQCIHLKRYYTKIILHVHNPSLIFVLYLIFDKAIKKITNFHNAEKNFTTLQKFFLRKSIAVSDCTIFVSKAILAEWNNYIPLRNAVAVPNGIPSKKLLQMYTGFNRDNDLNDVVVVAKFTEQKNPYRLIDILTQLDPGAKINWFGDGPLKDSCEAYADSVSSHSSSKINFRGQISRRELLSEVRNSKVYLSLSKWEGIGVANLEAMSLTPWVILSDIAPHREIAKHDGCTLLNLSLTNESILETINSKIKDFLVDGTQVEINQRRSTILSDYDIDNMLHHYVDIYDGV